MAAAQNASLSEGETQPSMQLGAVLGLYTEAQCHLAALAPPTNLKEQLAKKKAKLTLQACLEMVAELAPALETEFVQLEASNSVWPAGAPPAETVADWMDRLVEAYACYSDINQESKKVEDKTACAEHGCTEHACVHRTIRVNVMGLMSWRPCAAVLEAVHALVAKMEPFLISTGKTPSSATRVTVAFVANPKMGKTTAAKAVAAKHKNVLVISDRPLEWSNLANVTATTPESVFDPPLEYSDLLNRTDLVVIDIGDKWSSIDTFKRSLLIALIDYVPSFVICAQTSSIPSAYLDRVKLRYQKTVEEYISWP